MMEKLAAEMVKLGWTATVTGSGEMTFLKVAESPALRSPSIRGDRYVWDGTWSRKPETMAKRLDAFLRSCGKLPA